MQGIWWRRGTALIILVGLLSLAAVFGKEGLMQEDAGVIVGNRYSSSLSDSTLAALVNTIAGATRTIVVTPGTWNIFNDLTIPPNITLRVAPGAILNISSGKNLVINGPFEAGLRQVFSGAGTASFGRRLEGGFSPEWWGAVCDGTTNDFTALQKAMDGAWVSQTYLQLPVRATCLTTSPLTLRATTGIRGHSKFWSVLQYCGAGVRGLVFEPGSLSAYESSLRDFQIQGCDQTVGDAIVFANAARVDIDNVIVFRTGGHALKFTASIEVTLRNILIQQYSLDGIHVQGPSAVFLIDGLSVQSSGVPSRAALWFSGLAESRVQASTFEGYTPNLLNDAFMGQYGWIVDGAIDITFENNFIEWYQHAVAAVNTASSNILFSHNHLHDASCNTIPQNITIDFQSGGFAHDGIQVQHNRFGACGNDENWGYGNTTNWCFRDNKRFGPGGAWFLSDWDSSEACKQAKPLIVQGGIKFAKQISDIANTQATIQQTIGYHSAPSNFAPLAPGTCEDVGQGGIVGIEDGDVCVLGAPVSLMSTSTTLTCYVSAPDSGVGPGFGAVALRRCNLHPTATAPALTNQVWRFLVVKFTSPGFSE